MLIISHDSKWKRIFDTFVLFVVAYSIFSSLMNIAFTPDFDQTLYNVDLSVTVIFSIDLVLSKFFCFFSLFYSDFFCEFQDPETFKLVRNHKQIAVRYAQSLWLFIDIISTFPFDLLLTENSSTGKLTKILRLTRLSKLNALLDENKIKRLLKQIFENSDNENKIA